MMIKEWIQLTLHEMVDEIIHAIGKEVGDGFLTQESCKEIQKIIYRYSKQIFFAQSRVDEKKLKK